MSEKRFSEIERNCYYTSLVFDNQTQEELGTSKVLELLNYLHEENIYLKAKSSSWKITASKEGVEKTELIKQIVSLKEENEKLKKQRYDLYMDIVRLFEENEQLRQQNNELKLILKQHEFAEKGDKKNE